MESSSEIYTSSSDQHTSFFLSGGGDMGERTRAYNWAGSSLGPIDTWPQSLLTTLGIILNSKFPMFLWWGKDLIQFYNDAYRPSMGHNGKHPYALGQRGEECWLEIWPVIKPLIDQVFDGGEATWSEDQLIPIYRNGHLEDVYWTFGYSPVKDESGHVAGVLVVCNETTGKVTSVKKLELSDQRFQNLVREANVGIVVLTGEEYKVEVVNEAYAKLIDLLPEDLMGKDLFKVIPDAESTFRPLMNKVRTSGEDLYLYDQPYEVYVNDKKIHGYLNIVYQPYKEIDGTITGVIVLCQDVTESVFARQKILESENRFRNIVQQAPVAIALITGRDMIFESINKSMLQIINKTGIDVIGKKLFSVLPEIEKQNIADILHHVFDTGIPFQGYAVPIELYNGGKLELRYFDITYTPLFENNEVVSILHMAEDITERVVSKMKTEEAENIFRSLITSAPIAIVLFIGRDLIIETPNKAYVDLIGKSYDEIIGKPLAKAMPELEGQPFLQILDDVFTTGQMFETFDTKADVMHDGVLRAGFYDFSYTPLFNSSGNVYAILQIALEVTDEVLVKKALKESEQNLRNTILKAPVAMCIFKTSSHILEIANDRMFELWGKNGDDLIGKPIFDGLHEAKGQGFETLIDSVYNTGETVRAYELPLTLPRNGKLEIVYVDFVYEAFKETNGEISGVMAIAIDVTEKVLAKKKNEEVQADVRNTAERLQLALDAGKLGSYEMNLKTREIHCTEQCKKNFGTEGLGNLSYDQLHDIIVPEDKAYAMERLQDAIAKNSIYNAEYRIRRPNDGLIRWVKVSGRPVYNELNQAEKVIGITLDITEHKTFAEELSKQVKERTLELYRSNEDLLQFAHVASHDLKEPVRKVKTFSSRLRDEFGNMLPERAVLYLNKIEVATDRMFSMIDGVLSYSTLSSSEQPVEEINLHSIIDEIEVDLEVLLSQKKGLVVRESLPIIEGARVLIYQLFYNLINNSLKFAKPDQPSVISISSSIEKKDKVEYAEITIADNGIGFSEEYTHQIFDAFARLNPKDKYEGTGLGLALCKKIAERHHGSIKASGIMGVGAAFTILLPLKQIKQII